MIDLHTHTTFSDGTLDWDKLLEEANKSNIEVLSITDHDNLDSYKMLKNINYKEKFKGDIINGIEITSMFNGVKIDLLAYDFEISKLVNWVDTSCKDRKFDLDKEFEMMKNSCIKNNIIMGDISYDSYDKWPVDIIFNEIKKYDENKKYFKDKEWNDIDCFFAACTTKVKFPAYVDFSIHYNSAFDVVKEVKQAGGKIFVAHVFRYLLEDYEDFLNQLLENKIIDGVEVYHSSFNESQMKFLEKYCEKHNLLMSGGSDFHGEKKANIKLGIGCGNMNISKNILNNWKINNKIN